MKLQLMMVVVLAAALAGWSFEGASAQDQPPNGAAAAQQDQAQDVEGASRAEDSPLDEFDPEEATWTAWLGPIVLGIFGLILVFAIRRFTHANRRKLEEKNETESERK
jgi:NADH:ubiquinone oxidoreductase subunit 5 (subunit L)/multisubunit Na+/H+ antiporter MnhA subunit